MSDEIYLNSIRVCAGPFEIGAAIDGSILISAGVGKGKRLGGLTVEECYDLLGALDAYLTMRAVEEKM